MFTIYERDFPLGPTLAAALDDQEIDPRVGCAVPETNGSPDQLTEDISTSFSKGIKGYDGNARFFY